MHAKNRPGTLLLEAVIAVGLSAMLFSAIAGLLVAANLGASSTHTSERVRWASQEGISAMRSMAFSDLAAVTSGVAIYSASTHRWTVASGAPANIGSGLTRSISITPVYRDSSCGIVSTGGTVDPDSYYLTSTIGWTLPNGTARTYSSSGLRVQWDNPQGTCFKTAQSSFVTLDVHEGEWLGSKQLRDIIINNATASDATVTRITATWNRAGSSIQQMFIGTGKIWSDVGPGTPTGVQPSGTAIDVQDFTIPAHSTGQTYKIQFTAAMSGSTINLTFDFADGSSLTTGPFTPH